MHRRTSLVLMTVLCLVSAKATAEGCTKTVRWNDDPPFSMRAPDGRIVGVHVEQMRETLRRLGCSMTLQEMPWARALTELEAGRLDIVTGAIRTAERERYALFAAPGPQSRNVLWVRSDLLETLHISRLSELRGTGFRLGAQIGVNYGEDYEVLMRDPDFATSVRHVSTRRSLWLMIGAGRIDGLVADELTGRAELAEMGLQDRIRNSGVVVEHSPATTAFSRKTTSAEFVERFNKASEAMIRDGTLRAILLRYGAQP